MFKKILVPLDGSAPSRAGLEQALALARSEGGRVRFIHIVDESVLVQGMEPAFNVGELLDTLAAEGRKLLAEASAVARRRGIKADTVLYEQAIGRVSERIIREAKKWPADVIVMGTHGRRGIGRLVTGSDAESVLRESPVPLLLVKDRGRRRKPRRR